MISAFIDPTALAIVGGGTIVATALRAPARDIGDAMAGLGRLFHPHFAAAPLVARINAQTRIAKRHGTLALDRTVFDDADVAAALSAIVDGAGAEDIQDLLIDAQRYRAERAAAAAEVWAGMADAAPAMGMVGTLIGLARMFATMTDPAAIGGAMAVALLATLYGALIANLIALPVATRLRLRARAELHERERLIAPLAALAAQEAPAGRLKTAA